MDDIKYYIKCDIFLLTQHTRTRRKQRNKFQRFILECLRKRTFTLIKWIIWQVLRNVAKKTMHQLASDRWTFGIRDNLPPTRLRRAHLNSPDLWKLPLKQFNSANTNLKYDFGNKLAVGRQIFRQCFLFSIFHENDE